jgi:hypothetical protein
MNRLWIVSAPDDQIDDTRVGAAEEAVRSFAKGVVHLEANPEP